MATCHREKKSSVPASAVHILKLERYRERLNGPCARMTPRFVKRSMFFYITICKIDSQQAFAVWSGNSNQGLCINLEGWDGEGNGREVQKGGDVCIPMTDAPGSSDGEVSAYSAGDPGSIPESGRSTGEGNGNPLQYSCLENPVD